VTQFKFFPFLFSFLLLGHCYGQTGKLTGHLIMQDTNDVKEIVGSTMIVLQVNNVNKIILVGKEEYKSGGCMVSGCDPHWYCKRDKKKF
jgi:hypothetical protein